MGIQTRIIAILRNADFGRPHGGHKKTTEYVLGYNLPLHSLLLTFTKFRDSTEFSLPERG